MIFKIGAKQDLIKKRERERERESERENKNLVKTKRRGGGCRGEGREKRGAKAQWMEKVEGTGRRKENEVQRKREGNIVVWRQESGFGLMDYY